MAPKNLPRGMGELEGEEEQQKRAHNRKRASDISGIEEHSCTDRNRERPKKSPQQAPIPSGHADQNPPPWFFGKRPRRIISALTGPGGQATDQPKTRPLIKVDGISDVKALKR